MSICMPLILNMINTNLAFAIFKSAHFATYAHTLLTTGAFWKSRTTSDWFPTRTFFSIFTFLTTLNEY